MITIDDIGRDLSERLKADRAVLRLSSFSGSEKNLVTGTLKGRVKGPVVAVARDRADAEKRMNDLGFFLGGDGASVCFFPASTLVPLKSLSYQSDTVAERMRILNLLAAGDAPDILVVTPDILVQRLIPKKELLDFTDIVMVNEDVDMDSLAARFVSGGYTRTTLVEEPGDFSLRGGIVDFFSPMYEHPIRMELFGDTVESLRFFSVSTQRKIDSLTEALIVPAREAILKRENLDEIVNRVRKQASLMNIPVSKVRNIVELIKGEGGAGETENLLPLVYPETDTFFDYLPPSSVFVLDQDEDIRKELEEFLDKAAGSYSRALADKRLAVEPERLYLDWANVLDRLGNFRQVRFREFQVEAGREGENPPAIHFSIGENRALSSELKIRSTVDNPLLPLVHWIEDKKEKRFTTVLVAGTRSQAERLRELLAPYGIDPSVFEQVPDLHRTRGLVLVCIGHLSSGFVWPETGLALITEDEIFGAKRRVTRSASRIKGKDFLSFSELKEGDYVVHSEHGIGRYDGISKITLNKVTGDFLHIVYKDDDRLYLPVERMGMIQKYIGAEGYVPAMDKMGGKSWDKVKEKAKREVEKIAGELLNLYAERKVKPGYAFSSADSYFRDFEAGFEYEETPGQIAAIEDVIDDMEKDTPMDRLVCGDVGYGKTEVALRAAFKAVNDGKQVAVLVPTTILAEQHTKTFTERFQRYPVKVEGLSRFKTKGRQNDIVVALAQGRVDVVVGTHRLLSQDIHFKDLGLVVVDEEQRFGVKHKERLKKLRNTVDVLTLTATPIPRTLHMAMTGIRDISVITTPPEKRQAIITYVSEFEDAVIVEGIRRELDRKGQIFFVHNHVKSIDRINEHLKNLVPEVRSAVAHGQMNEKDLEKVMMQFVNREIDVLVCTTIIESGLDIPAANTMFINKADRFGLAQMYQLRGRIGRGEEQAYAYLFIPEDSALSRDARKRLRVLMEYSDLGAGFQIAMSDLQIRGGGAALGASQSGHIAAVGYDMFLRLMEEAMSDIKGEPQVEDLEPEINVQFSAYFSEEYIPSLDQRLMLYRRLSGFVELKELSDVRDELIDRYGEMPEEAQNMLLRIMLKILAAKAGVKRLDISAQQMNVVFSERHQKNPQNIVDLVTPEPDRFELTPECVLKVRLPKAGTAAQMGQVKKILKDIARCVNG